MRRRSAAILTLLGLSLVACAAQDWKEHNSKEGRFKAKFPGDPVTQQQQIPTAAGNLTMYMHAVERDSGNQAFMLMYNDYPAETIRNSKAEDLLKACKDGVLQSASGKTSKEREIKIDGHPGMEFSFDGNSGGRDMKCSWRIYLVKNRLYQLAVLRFGQETPAADVKQFFDSFALSR